MTYNLYNNSTFQRVQTWTHTEGTPTKNLTWRKTDQNTVPIPQPISTQHQGKGPNRSLVWKKTDQTKAVPPQPIVKDPGSSSTKNKRPLEQESRYKSVEPEKKKNKLSILAAENERIESSPPRASSIPQAILEAIVDPSANTKVLLEQLKPNATSKSSSGPKNISYAERVARWFTNPEEVVLNDPRSKLVLKKTLPEIIFQHNFSTHVDQYVNEKYGIKHKDYSGEYYYFPVIIEKDGKTTRAEIQYSFDNNGVCYHRHCIFNQTLTQDWWKSREGRAFPSKVEIKEPGYKITLFEV